MSLNDHVAWYLDCTTYGGILHERLLAALVLAEGVYAGLIFSFPAAGRPTVEFWDRIDDLERGGFAPIRAERARAISDALPRFLEQLEHAEQVAQTKRAAERMAGTGFEDARAAAPRPVDAPRAEEAIRRADEGQGDPVVRRCCD